MPTLIPKILHQMARTKKLTWEEARLTKRTRQMMPDWTYHLWDNGDQLQLVRDHFPQYAEQHGAISFGVARADIARYVCMYVSGGFYADTDYKFFRPLDQEVRASSCILPREGSDPQKGARDPDYLGLGNALLGSQPGHPFWKRLIDHVFRDMRPEALRKVEDVIETTGPEVMTRFYTAHRDEFPDVFLPEKNCFFPELSRMGTRTSATDRTYGAHLYWASWRDKSPVTAFKIQVRRKLNGLLC